jgi:hypothetical protein
MFAWHCLAIIKLTWRITIGCGAKQCLGVLVTPAVKLFLISSYSRAVYIRGPYEASLRLCYKIISNGPSYDSICKELAPL